MFATAAESPQSVCRSCGLQAPTRWVIFYQNIGLLVTRQTAEMSGHMCRRCIRAYFKSYTLTTLFLGWWGVISFCVTPFILLNNIGRFVISLTLPGPPAFSMANIQLASASAPISVGADTLKFRLIYGAIVCTVLLGVAAYNSVGFVEKYAPSLNAKLHSGEITESADAEYVGSKLFKDIEALSADVKSEDWAGMRAECLSRESYLKDLDAQNARLRRAAAKERASGKADACEQFAVDQLVPALDDYTRSMDRFFSVLKSTTTPTAESIASLKNIAAQQDNAVSQISKYFSESKARGCEK